MDLAKTLQWILEVLDHVLEQCTIEARLAEGKADRVGDQPISRWSARSHVIDIDYDSRFDRLSAPGPKVQEHPIWKGREQIVVVGG